MHFRAGGDDGIPTVLLRKPVRIASDAEPRFSPILLPGGDDGIRTHDPLLAGQVLSQLSYTPKYYWEFAVSPIVRFRAGRTKWTRTTDLVLIRHAL